MNTIKSCILCITLITVISGCNAKQEDTKIYEGVVTATIIPAKVIQINELIKNPAPGKSYIGSNKIICEVDKMPKVMANWTIVKVQYIKYPKPKKITYKLLSEEKEIEVQNKVLSLTITGDLSKYISK